MSQQHLYGARPLPPPNLAAPREYEDEQQQTLYTGSTTNLMNPSVQRFQDYGVSSQRDRDFTRVID